ncbi:hypothetical protein GCM10009793_06600 [Brachybacterium phenoliresistens]
MPANPALIRPNPAMSGTDTASAMEARLRRRMLRMDMRTPRAGRRATPLSPDVLPFVDSFAHCAIPLHARRTESIRRTVGEVTGIMAPT